jgi:hypothetical protein
MDREAIAHGNVERSIMIRSRRIAFDENLFSAEFRNTGFSRTHSPDFLHHVFGWDPMQIEWDGLLCQVQPPARTSVESFRMPVCLKWRSESAGAPVNYNCLPVPEELWVRKPQSTTFCEKEVVCKDERLETVGRNGSDL